MQGESDHPVAADGHAPAQLASLVVRILLFTVVGGNRPTAVTAHELRPDIRALLLCGPVRRRHRINPEDPGLRGYGFSQMARLRTLQAVSDEYWFLARRRKAQARRATPRSALRPLYDNHASG